MPVILFNVTEVEFSRYQILWTTPSFTNIAEHLLIYKQVKVILTILILFIPFLMLQKKFMYVKVYLILLVKINTP